MRALLCCLLLTAAAQAQAESIQLLVPGSRVDLASGRLLEGGPLPSPLRLAARGEWLGQPLLVSAAPGLHRVDVKPPCRAGRCLPAQLYWAAGVKVRAPTESEGVRGLGAADYPDILLPGAEGRIGPSGAGLLWLDIEVPLDAPAGRYAGSVKLKRAQVSFQVEVLPLRLPQRDVARLSAANFGSMKERLSRDPAGFRRWMQLAKAHLLSVEPIRITPAVTEGGVDWEGYAQAVGPYLSGQAFTKEAGYAGPLPGLPVVRWVVPPTDWWPVDDGSRGLPPDPKAWVKALSDWGVLAQREGWGEGPEPTVFSVFINSLDEPKTEAQLRQIAGYLSLMKAAKLPAAVRPRFQIDGPFGTPIEGMDIEAQVALLDPVVDLWNLHGAPLTMPHGHLEDFLQHGDKVTVYASNTSGEPSIPPLVVDAPISGARAWGWIVWRYGLEGAMNWELDLQAGCVEEPRCSPGHRHNLDATLIFRGEEVGAAPGQPIPSMRLKLLRRGAQDAALLSALSAKDPEAAARISEELVPYALGDNTQLAQPAAWSKAPLSYLRARQEILRRMAGWPPLAGRLRVDPRPEWARPWLVRHGWSLAAAAAALALISLLAWRRARG